MRKSPAFGLLRQYLPVDQLFRVAGDVDAVYDLIATACETQEESLADVKHSPIPEAIRDKLEIEAFQWNDIYQQEVVPQANQFGINLQRDVFGGTLVFGDRIVLVGPAPVN